MRVSVAFHNERLECDVPDDRLLGHWSGPTGAAADSGRLVRDALERPVDWPPLRQAVVPGDRVAIACADDLPDARAVLAVICQVLIAAGVAPEDIAVVVAGAGDDLIDALPAGARLVRHDPADRSGLAYLATTAGGRRVYLSRELTDADLVLPVGPVGFDPVLGHRGPWSVVWPGLSDLDTQRSFRAGPAREAAALAEALDVTWLLGCQLQLGLVSHVSGLATAVAGQGQAVRDASAAELDRLWSFHAEARAELVIVGIGAADRPSGIEDLAAGLATAMNLVARGGKIVALSRAAGALGPAVQRLIAAGEARDPSATLRGHEADPDYTAARQLAQALAWADVYLLSGLANDLVEDLALIALDRPEEARRLIAVSRSCLIVSQADRTRASAGEDED